MKVVAIIQAHCGSHRFPAKVLQDIAGMTMLDRVIERVKRARSPNAVVVATSTLAIDDAIECRCARSGTPVFRGSDADVISRFVQTAQDHRADVCIRITSDCPLADPGIIDRIVDRFLAVFPAVDYSSNKIPQSYPRGLDTEVFTTESLVHAERLAIEAYQRTHVTPFIYEHPELFRLLSVTDPVDRAHWRWTVDTPEDLEFVRQVYAHFSGRAEFTWRDVLALLERQPELMEINKNVRQKALREG